MAEKDKAVDAPPTKPDVAGPRPADQPDRDTRWAEWRSENAGAIAIYNRWFEADGQKFIREPAF